VDIEMAIKDWEDDWRILVLIQDIPVEVEEEEEVRQDHKQLEKVTVPNKPRTSQNKAQKKKRGTSKIGSQTGKKNNT
jgi:hypothetical protein